jgi:hypothetical protein
MRLAGRLPAGLAAVAAGVLLWGVAAPPADAQRPPKPRPTPSASPTPSPSPSASPTAGPACGFAVVASPNASPLDNVLFDVAVLSASDAWAVGEYLVDGGGAVRTLIQHFDGTAWTTVPSPNRLTGTGRNQINSLRGVTAIAGDDVWAVGYAGSYDATYQTLTMHWNGQAWSIVDSPNYTFPGAYNALHDVAAAGSNDVWAVGGSPFGGVSARGLLLHFDGVSWSLRPGPPNVEFWASSTRSGVVAVSASDVWAVGDYDAWHFDGTAWTVPAAGAQFAADVHAGPGAVWAVGSFIADPYSGGVRYPIGYRFTGTEWQQQHAAALKPGAFNGVAVRAAADVIAVGYSGVSAYALRWDGTEWQRLAAGNANPSPSSTLAIANVLLGVAHAGTSMWAVGYYFTGTGTEAGVQRTLIERYTC